MLRGSSGKLSSSSLSRVRLSASARHERRHPDDLADREVQARVQPAVVGGGCGGHLAEARPEQGAGLAVEGAGRGGARRSHLEDLAQAQQVVELGGGGRRRRGNGRRGQRVAHERAAVASAARPQVAGVAQLADRLADGVAADREPHRELALRRQRVTGRHDAEADGLHQPRRGVLERVAGADRAEDGVVETGRSGVGCPCVRHRRDTRFALLDHR